MASLIEGRDHTFNASASAFGGHVELPFERVIAAQAPVALSPDGGYTTARTDNFSVEGFFSFKSAYTQVSGIISKKRPGWTTLTTSVVEGLNISEILTADRVVAQIITEHPASKGKYAPFVNFVGTRFDNLRIGGALLDVTLNLGLCKPAKADQHGYPGHATLKDAAFLKRVKSAREYNSSVSENQVLCSLFESVKITGNLPATRDKNVFTIPGFGKITLAELSVEANHYRLSMLRLQLGSPLVGHVSIGNGETNGRTDP
ncbi:MAG TPA: hypothetical protein VLK33_04410 [Terriglobales bacterium]|nr:hypothetical protein [Terriglobales bacterium]